MEYFVRLETETEITTFKISGDDFAYECFMSVCNDYPFAQVDLIVAETGEVVATNQDVLEIDNTTMVETTIFINVINYTLDNWNTQTQLILSF